MIRTAKILCGSAFVVLAACDPWAHYRVVAQNAARAGRPVPGARAIVSCGQPYPEPCAITGADGAATCWGPVGGLPMECRFEVRARGFASQSTELSSICTKGYNDRCPSGEWTAQLQPSGEAPAPAHVAPPPKPSCASDERFDNWLGLLAYRRCANGEVDISGLHLNGVDSVTAHDTAIGEHASWMVATLHRGERDTLALLRIDDAGPVSLAWQSEPKPRDAWTFRMQDFDHDGNPELHVRAGREPAGSFRIDEAEKVVPWDGRPSAAEQEMCGWLASKTGATTCDPWLDAATDTRPLADGSWLAIVEEPKLWMKNDGHSAVFAIHGDQATLVQELRGGLIFEPAKPGCFLHHLIFAWFDDMEHLCLRGGALKEE